MRRLLTISLLLLTTAAAAILILSLTHPRLFHSLFRPPSPPAPAPISLLIPEGWTIFHIAERTDALGLCPRDAFLRAARDPQALAAADLTGRDSFEGYLFPATYPIPPDLGCERLVARLHQEHQRRWRQLATTHAEQLAALEAQGFDQHALLTLASLVERESGVGSERPTIARVFYNRLAIKMRLQTDPTCVYGEDTYRLKPSPALCKDRSSRYSTYVIDGLPPGPIANPGLDSLRAVLRPDERPEAREYLFFVANRDGSGSHVFSKTFDEHRAAIQHHLRDNAKSP
jgi:UPF0755 protein